ncbi:MAG: DUF4395 family protein [Thermoanaerobaculia bacterium]|nr:DUF4395 family protein [Thermoanaerobaculia bacterium]
MTDESLDFASKRNFILQQGLDDPSREACPLQYSALLFQPRMVAVVLLVAILLQSPGLFLALGAVLWWSALFPSLNPFDALYNATLGSRPGRARLGPAPPPRRFAQTLAGAFSVGIAVSLLLGHHGLAYGLEAFFAAAVVALGFGRFCFGSFVYHLLRGRLRFALETLPWSRRREGG